MAGGAGDGTLLGTRESLATTRAAAPVALPRFPPFFPRRMLASGGADSSFSGSAVVCSGSSGTTGVGLPFSKLLSTKLFAWPAENPVWELDYDDW